MWSNGPVGFAVTEVNVSEVLCVQKCELAWWCETMARWMKGDPGCQPQRTHLHWKGFVWFLQPGNLMPTQVLQEMQLRKQRDNECKAGVEDTELAQALEQKMRQQRTRFGSDTLQFTNTGEFGWCTTGVVLVLRVWAAWDEEDEGEIKVMWTLQGREWEYPGIQSEPPHLPNEVLVGALLDIYQQNAASTMKGDCAGPCA